MCVIICATGGPDLRIFFSDNIGMAFPGMR